MAKKTPRAPAPVVLDRTNEVQALLQSGRTRAYILQSTSDWGLDERTIDAYIRRAMDRIKEINKVTIEENMALITNELWDLVRTAKISGDGNLVAKGLAQLAKIKGLEELTINHVVQDKRELSDANDEDLDDFIEGEVVEYDAL